MRGLPGLDRVLHRISCERLRSAHAAHLLVHQCEHVLALLLQQGAVEVAPAAASRGYTEEKSLELLYHVGHLLRGLAGPQTGRDN